jgi:dTDP-glucose pyrophosphorylase
MRAIILAGGYAKRMGQLAAELPKSLLPIAGRPAIDYILDRLDDTGPEKILLTTNMKFKPAFDSQLASKHPNIELVDKYDGEYAALVDASVVAHGRIVLPEFKAPAFIWARMQSRCLKAS